MKLVLATKLVDHIKFGDRFHQYYKAESGHKSKLTLPAIEHTFTKNIKKVFNVFEGDTLVGQISIIQRGECFVTNPETDTRSIVQSHWSASEAWIRPAYRSQGYLRRALEELIAKHDVSSARIEFDRAVSHHKYYKSLGFQYYAFLVRSSHDDVEQEKYLLLLTPKGAKWVLATEGTRVRVYDTIFNECNDKEPTYITSARLIKE